MPDRRTLKQNAKEINRNAKVNAYSFSLLFFVITLALRALQSYADRDTVILNVKKFGTMLLDAFPTADLSALFDRVGGILTGINAAVPVPHLPAAAVTFIVVISWLLSCLLSAGYTLYIMGIRQGKTMGYGTLLDGFAFAGKIILLELWRTLVITVWSFVFVIPGIIASYRYSFALYNLLDNPEMGVTEAMVLSKQQTRGYKWDLFLLDLSFIGWDLLMPLTAGILSIYVKPYREQSRMGYYRAVSHKNASPQPEDGAYHDTDNDKPGE